MVQASKTQEITEYVENVIVKKRGRKPKKDLEIKENINVKYEETISNEIISENIINKNTDDEIMNTTNDDTLSSDIVDNIMFEEDKPLAKKRGRKPKGGKIIHQITPLNNVKDDKPNVILHLKCSIKDLQTNTLLNSNIDGFNFNTCVKMPYEIINNNVDNTMQHKFKPINTNEPALVKTVVDNDSDSGNDYESYKQNKDSDNKEVWKKLKQLEHNLHINNISDKKSACFWCTYEFDNPPVYIPKHYIKDSYQVYGCFCSPECSTAFLMEENIDSSAKFERYYLINHIYSKIYDYKKNIKPAPNPYYMLDKYYGNLTIQEYRALLRNERLFLVVDKPLTRILPELHEDNDDFIINNKIIPSNTYQIKKKMQKTQQSKNNILSEKFGLL